MRNTVHIGNTLAASGLAMAERTGASGRDLLLAMVIGYEAAGRINTVMRSGGGGPQGVHTSQIVSFAGAVLCSKLLKATDDQMAHALGLAALSAGGISTASNSWGREYMGANASFTGTNAALAASRGYKGNEDMLAAGGGYFEVYGAGKKAVVDTLTQPIKDKPFDITKWLAIKLVPGGHGSHATAEAAVNAARQANVSVDQIANIYIARPGGIARVDTAAPRDWVEAIHSTEYMIASAMVDKDYGFVHGTDPKIHRPEIGRVMKLIAPDPNPPAHQYPYSYGGTITIVTKSGQRFTSTVDAPRASGPRGIDWADIDKKYQALMPGSKLPKSKIDESFKVIRAYDQVKNASELTNLLKA
jgi:2-methylcitrate dehydratase PrpD